MGLIAPVILGQLRIFSEPDDRRRVPKICAIGLNV